MIQDCGTLLEFMKSSLEPESQNIVWLAFWHGKKLILPLGTQTKSSPCNFSTAASSEQNVNRTLGHRSHGIRWKQIKWTGLRVRLHIVGNPTEPTKLNGTWVFLDFKDFCFQKYFFCICKVDPLVSFHTTIAPKSQKACGDAVTTFFPWDRYAA